MHALTCETITDVYFCRNEKSMILRHGDHGEYRSVCGDILDRALLSHDNDYADTYKLLDQHHKDMIFNTLF
jgi:hypothetical protein